MRQSKNKLHAEIKQVMDDYWGSYLNGDLKTWASYLPDDYRNIGATKAEIWNSKKEIVEYTEMIIDQTVGMAEMRNNQTLVIPYDPYFMAHELGDLYVKAEEGWVFYASYRLSSLLEKTADGWKILHQHGSYPDHKTEEGEAFAFSALKVENKKLRDAIQSRTIDLERKNRELEIEAALERVRSRTMAMQKSTELSETASLMFKQVERLGLRPWSCGFNIWDHEGNKISQWVSTGDGRILPPFQTPSHEDVFVRFLAAAQNGEPLYVEEIGGEALKQHYDFMKSLPIVEKMINEMDDAGIQLPAQQVFHVAFFSHGYLMFITYEPTPEFHEIFIRFAKVFEQTYTRFLDLQTKEEQALQLIAEKERLEKTLHDLRVTQKQLIQSEKMASLGELTAGIAHEIQNPLNFVNNFSEVSEELLDEMNEEMKNGDLDEVMAIAHDLKLNLKKINHHGRRADAIVKGMLQHSRKSAGEKEATDINKLADEYLRLAYHGLRAKEKSFNATLHTDFDPTLEPLMVIPQEIGRVLLNLITNAFYTVHEKKKSNGADFQPAVTIRTRKFSDHVTIAVTDNGNGIPQQVLDKIFQPFFTTKPTGEGTGLGLSLSYDIVKAHGGEIKVESQIMEGTEFAVLLPLRSQ